MSKIEKPKYLQKKDKVFVNRSLNMSHITAVGFDMDHTIAVYNREAFETLAFHETLKKFIAAGYPEELLKLKFRNDFLIRGLLVDRERGNLLKVDGHKYVKDAYHGHTQISKADRHKLYNSQSYKAENFLSVDTFFALSEVQLFVEIVDFMAKNPNRITKSYVDIYKDLRYFIDLSHRDGSIKNVVLGEPEKYIVRDKHLPKTLATLKRSGKELFLLTNSHWEYSNAVMSYIFDAPFDEFNVWQDYFDQIIVGASKPSFFTGRQPFFEVLQDSGLFKTHEGPLHPKSVYHGGNAKLFEELTGHKGDAILYVGDHIYGDIIQSKDRLNWRTLLIVEELENEIPKLVDLEHETLIIKQMIRDREILDENLQKNRSKINYTKHQLQKSLDIADSKRAHYLELEQEKYLEIDRSLSQELHELNTKISISIKSREEKIHPIWGELMKVGLEKSRFANQVNSFACLYTAKVSNLKFYSPYKRFLSVYESMPHDFPF